MKKIFYIISFVLLLSLAGIGGFFIGKSTNQPVIGTTFYAVIDVIRDQNIWVSGLDVNDINSRGEFYFTIEDTTKLQWRHTEISLSDLKAGNTISVTYTGLVLETSPAGIEDVIQVQLLDDKI
ncbi:hypothetical protein [uncultured Robinsoniella sp.]|uniref:hypothetical protein n=1 Tax=uncultured Robinsoniella sp. TaxID=904190 RepID=UPI00374FC24B